MPPPQQQQQQQQQQEGYLKACVVRPLEVSCDDTCFVAAAAAAAAAAGIAGVSKLGGQGPRATTPCSWLAHHIAEAAQTFDCLLWSLLVCTLSVNDPLQQTSDCLLW
jgi:hypothetical protein